ncbi:MAG: glycosyltransferase family 2 protein [Acidimicrobiales bacterium]
MSEQAAVTPNHQEKADSTAMVSIVVTPRERFGLSRASLESIYANTTVDFRLIYVDGNSPKGIAAYLRRAAVEYGFELLSHSEYLSPNQARNLGMAKVDTPYVVFVDNDLIVTEGWLQHLLKCAEHTGAPVVGPLYFEGDPGKHVVHMAGGDYSFEGEHGSRKFSTVHRHQGQRLDELEAEIVREPVDFVEFHCMLVNSQFLRDLGGLDEKLLSTREHLDLCLATANAGQAVYIEPQSRVTYLTPPPVDMGDIPFFLRRWSEAWNQASLEHFCRKHGIAATYTDRLVGMRARRQLLLEPIRKTSKKLLPTAVDRFLMRVMARLEREANRALFRVPADLG